MKLSDVIHKATMKTSSLKEAAKQPHVYITKPKEKPIGQTKSGKAIYNNPSHPAHADFSKQDRIDSYFSHSQQLKTAKSPSEVEHHQNAMHEHWNASLGAPKEVKKSLSELVKAIKKKKHKPHHHRAHAHHKKGMDFLDKYKKSKDQKHLDIALQHFEMAHHHAHKHLDSDISKAKICEPKEMLIKEHKRLVSELKHPQLKKLKKEAKIQGKELKEYKMSKSELLEKAKKAVSGLKNENKLRNHKAFDEIQHHLQQSAIHSAHSHKNKDHEGIAHQHLIAAAHAAGKHKIDIGEVKELHNVNSNSVKHLLDREPDALKPELKFKPFKPKKSKGK